MLNIAKHGRSGLPRLFLCGRVYFIARQLCKVRSKFYAKQTKGRDSRCYRFYRQQRPVGD
ncbi:hypothetical protein CF65_00601 [Aggregatibacter actinomycetemcomitans HK1651]|nr:hypothetical protein CF65_00601 [Aggregatibacter actinomycetemcomitans HK1651]